MIFQLLLSTSLILIIVYAFTQKAKSPLIGVVTTFAALSGLYFVWAPTQANVLAHAIGIGRGADLIFYCWGIISLALLLNLHFKVRSHMELVTKLARKIAILEAEQQNDSENRLQNGTKTTSNLNCASSLVASGRVAADTDRTVPATLPATPPGPL